MAVQPGLDSFFFLLPFLALCRNIRMGWCHANLDCYSTSVRFACLNLNFLWRALCSECSNRQASFEFEHRSGGLFSHYEKKIWNLKTEHLQRAWFRTGRSSHCLFKFLEPLGKVQCCYLVRAVLNLPLRTHISRKGSAVCMKILQLGTLYPYLVVELDLRATCD